MPSSFLHTRVVSGGYLQAGLGVSLFNFYTAHVLSVQPWRHRFPSENDLSAILALMSRHLTIITFLPPPSEPPNTLVQALSSLTPECKTLIFFSFTATQLSPFVYIAPNKFLSSFSNSAAIFPSLHTL